jgi:hypothetical protein
MEKILNKYDTKFLSKILKYYNLSNIDNNNDKDNLIKIISNNLYLDNKNVLRKKDYENRYILLKNMIIAGNTNPELKNELNLF